MPFPSTELASSTVKQEMYILDAFDQKVPKTNLNVASEGDKRRRRNRVAFNTEHVEVLEEVFVKSGYPSVATRTRLSDSINLPLAKVDIWFKNRRVKHRKCGMQVPNTDEDFNGDLDKSLEETTVLPTLEKKDNINSPIEGVKKPRPRVYFQKFQVDLLEEVFQKTPYPPSNIKEEIAKNLNLPVYKIDIWYYNRRGRDKKSRQVSSNNFTITEPLEDNIEPNIDENKYLENESDDLKNSVIKREMLEVQLEESNSFDDCTVLNNVKKHGVPEDLKNLLISTNPELNIKFTFSKNQNIQMMVSGFLLEKDKGPYRTIGGPRIIDWKCNSRSCPYILLTFEGMFTETESIKHNHEKPLEIIARKLKEALQLQGRKISISCQE